MTIDEAIANYQGISIYLQRYYAPDAEVKLQITNAKCIEWFTEVADWLTELKETKRLLKAAVEDSSAEAESICAFCKNNDLVNGCRFADVCEEDNHYVWRYADEALALIGGNENG